MKILPPPVSRLDEEPTAAGGWQSFRHSSELNVVKKLKELNGTAVKVRRGLFAEGGRPGGLAGDTSGQRMSAD